MSDLKKQLINFFLWFRDHGEEHVGKSVEELIDVYLQEAEDNRSRSRSKTDCHTKMVWSGRYEFKGGEE